MIQWCVCVASYSAWWVATELLEQVAPCGFLSGSRWHHRTFIVLTKVRTRSIDEFPRLVVVYTVETKVTFLESFLNFL